MGRMIELPDFENEHGLDFSDPIVEEMLSKALVEVRATFGKEYPMLFAGVKVFTVSDRIRRENPSNAREVIGYVCKASPEIINQAIATTKKSGAVHEWMHCKSHAERAEYLKEIAQVLRRKRFFFLALMMLEAGKNRWEADGEFCEAIDFLEYYATYAPFLAELNQATLYSPDGQCNEGLYEPVGIGASIQPWNFPLAISIGPTVAGLVMGNPMIYKPAEQTSITGYYLAQCVYESGIPPEVFHFMPGGGEEVGRYLVRHPDVKLIAFTGSKDVRKEIQDAVQHFNSTVLPTLPPQDRHEKQIASAESGGKGTIIVDSDADMESAAQGIFDSAFGFAGQKCSAGTRAIVVGDDSSIARFDFLMNTLADMVVAMKIGSPENKENFMGPVIDETAKAKIERYKDIALLQGACHQPVKPIHGMGHFVSPMIVGGLKMDSPVMQEEIFGPLLAITYADSFEEALDMANDSEFGLTGGVYTNNDEHWQMAMERFEVGNLYRNRKISGSIVGQNPFGGFKQSGNSAKAGGWDYLLNFVRRKNLCSQV